MARIIAVTSGKGGVGKSNFVLNVGICLAMMDQRVCILDADLGLANIDVLLGIRPNRTLEEVILGRSSVGDIIIKTDYNVELIPGSSGTQDMADLSREQIGELVKQVSAVSESADCLLVDTASGISTGVISFLLAAPEVIVGVNPEPTSLTDAYAMIKVLTKNDYQGRISMFSSMVKNSASGHTLYKKISSASQRFLDIHIEYLGSVYHDEKLSRAVTDQIPAVVRYPTSDISRCYRIIASTILGQGSVEVDHERFWTRLINMLMKAPKPKTMKAVSGNDVQKNGDLRGIIHDLLDEQRKTRVLLERLVERIEQHGACIRPKPGSSA
jgi:flagellar biosynthesis protein FlhG